jgi:hypothetical protein
MANMDRHLEVKKSGMLNPQNVSQYGWQFYINTNRYHNGHYLHISAFIVFQGLPEILGCIIIAKGWIRMMRL